MANKPSTLPRRLITDHVLTELKTQNFPVGDMAPPLEKHGWPETDPNQPDTDFVPFLSLGVGASRGATGSVGDSSTEYELIYTVANCGVARVQAEAMADHIRLHMHSLDRQSLTDAKTHESWRITQYKCTNLGGIQKIVGAFPDYFSQMDEYYVRVSKER